MIAKKLHLIWIGSKPPAQVNAARDRWQSLLPEPWTVRLWTDDDEPARDLPVDPRTMRQAPANLMRLLILRDHGGVYVDADIHPEPGFIPVLESVIEPHPIMVSAIDGPQGGADVALIGIDPGTADLQPLIDGYAASGGGSLVPHFQRWLGTQPHPFVMLPGREFNRRTPGGLIHHRYGSLREFLPEPADLAETVAVRTPNLPNFGDVLNLPLVEWLSGKRARRAAPNEPAVMVIGSSLSNAGPGDAIWGQGFLGWEVHLRTPPAAVHAVRGPLTREKLRRHGIDCPAVYGDPAALIARMWPAEPGEDPAHRIGFIPHWRELEQLRLPALDHELDTIIDVRGRPQDVAAKIRRCERIVSSSLHGLITAHAYGVPAVWVKLSGLPLGDTFKFCDYYQDSDLVPINVNSSWTAAALLDLAPQPPPAIDLDALLRACPFPLVEDQQPPAADGR